LVGADAGVDVAVTVGVPVEPVVALAEVVGAGGAESSAEQAASPPSAPATRARLLIV
jgi:hypothetical protein